jgi:hypothetical protein
MSEVKVNKISPRSGTTVTLGDSGDTFTIPSGATINNQGTATNFGATGSASWTTTVKTSGFTAVAGEGYFVDTTSGAISVNLPAGSAGAVVAFKDYLGTFDTNALTLVQNGSDKIGGSAVNAILDTEGIAVTLVFVDSTQGWLVTDSGLQSEAPLPYSADFLVIAGGGGGGFDKGGGGGAGGYRNSFATETSGGGNSSETALELIPGNAYTITVGGGGAGGSGTGATGTSGVASSISGTGITTVTSDGGGGGGTGATGVKVGLVGGSGGGSSTNTSPGGPGTSNQGFDGGTGSSSPNSSGGGGGAGEAGNTDGQAYGGDGLASSITGSAVTRGGGGGGNIDGGGSGRAGDGGGGNGAGTSPAAQGTAGTANTGGGGGGGTGNAPQVGLAGGSGVVILSVADADYSGTTTGSPTVATGVSGKTVMTFNSSGSYTA